MALLRTLVPALFLLASPAFGGDAANPPADGLAEILGSGLLAETRNPVVANFLVEEGSPLLTEAERAQALDQLRSALRRQTNIITLAMQGMGGLMASDSMQSAMTAAKGMLGPKALLGGLTGVLPVVPTLQPGQMERDMKQALTGPWVRGIAAAQALDKLGDGQAAARFYVNCLQVLQADWLPGACLGGIAGLGPERAEKLLVWMLDNADSISITNQAGMLGESEEKRAKDTPLDPGAVQLRNAALEGLGALVGSGGLDTESRQRAFGRVLAYASGKGNEPYRLGAAQGLGRAADARGIEPLRKLAKTRGEPLTKQAALRALAIAFHDQAAIKQLRGELDDRDPEEQIRAAQALYEAGDEAAFKWAVEVIGHRRVMEAKLPDIRPRVVRDLVELGGERARKALEQALAEGPPNDWLTAWVRVGLLELGDTSQLPAIEAALAKVDWSLDPRGFRSVWRALKPLIMAVVGTVVSGGLGLAAPSTFEQAKRAVQLVGNLVTGERSRFLAKAGQREAAIAELHWQTADALAIGRPAGAARILEGMLVNPEPAVRLSAALALVRLDQAESISGIAKAFALDYGTEAGIPHTPEVRASLLRAARLRFAGDPRTRQIFAAGAKDQDAAVRFIALSGQRKAA